MLGAFHRSSRRFGRYVTLPNSPVSIQPHNDVQDVFIIQVQSTKAWTVWEPTAAEALASGRPPSGFGHRGKEGEWPIDIEVARAGKASANFLLEPGDVLFVPRGHPHNTSTPPAGPTVLAGGPTGLLADASVHITLGLVSCGAPFGMPSVSWQPAAAAHDSVCAAAGVVGGVRCPGGRRRPWRR